MDPGRLDGVLGEETKLAIRRFRSIAHLPSERDGNAQLTADILSELASMSADAGGESQARSEADCRLTPEAASCMEAEAAGQTSPVPSATAPQKSVASPPVSAAATAAKPKAPGSTPTTQAVRTQAEPAMPAAPVRSTAAPVTETPAAPPAPTPANTKLYFVQVASLISLAAAKQEWTHIQKANPAVLQGAPVYFERKDLKVRGVFYRILIGPKPSHSEANALCSVLKQDNQSCVVTVRNGAEI